MVAEENSKERARAHVAALEHEIEGYDAKIAAAKVNGDKDEQSKYESRKKQANDSIKAWKAKLAGKGGKDEPELVEPGTSDEDSLEE